MNEPCLSEHFEGKIIGFSFPEHFDSVRRLGTLTASLVLIFPDIRRTLSSNEGESSIQYTVLQDGKIPRLVTRSHRSLLARGYCAASSVIDIDHGSTSALADVS